MNRECVNDEVFLDHPNFSKYKFSNYGRVLIKSTNRFKKHIYRKKGDYLYTYLTSDIDNISRRYTVKYLIYEIFSGHSLNKNDLIKHKDNDSYNIHIDNLYVTKLNQHSFIDLTGKKFGRLTVLKRVENRGVSKCWSCQCDCGTIKTLRATSLVSGGTKSCGCLYNELNEGRKLKIDKLNFSWTGYGDISGSFWTHINGHAKSRNLKFNITIENAWDLFIKQNKKCSLTNLELIMKGGGRTASLDRIDNNEGYVLGNIQWVHKDINIMKNKHDQSYFIDLCKKVALNN